MGPCKEQEMNAEPAIREFGNPFYQDHARELAYRIVRELPRDITFPAELPANIYRLCRATIDPLSEIANGQRNLAAETLALHTRPMIITGSPSTFRASIKAAWRAARSGRW